MGVFCKPRGDTLVIRVLDFLIEGRGIDYSLTDIADNAGIGWTTLHRIWGKLEQLQIVRQTRTIGRAKLYQLNASNPSVKELIRLYDTLLFHSTEKHLGRAERKRRVIIG